MTNGQAKVVLLLDESEESKQALQRLRAVYADVVIVRASGTAVPSAKVGNTLYIGRWGIDFVADALGGKPISPAPAPEPAV